MASPTTFSLRRRSASGSRWSHSGQALIMVVHLQPAANSPRLQTE
jgi:hypothetical protein